MVQETAVAQAQLRTLVERIERLEDEKAALAADIKEVYAEAKGQGFDVKTLRIVVRLHKQEQSDREEEAALLELYLHALDMLPDEGAANTPAVEDVAATS